MPKPAGSCQVTLGPILPLVCEPISSPSGTVGLSGCPSNGASGPKAMAFVKGSEGVHCDTEAQGYTSLPHLVPWALLGLKLPMAEHPPPIRVPIPGFISPSAELTPDTNGGPLSPMGGSTPHPGQQVYTERRTRPCSNQPGNLDSGRSPAPRGSHSRCRPPGRH